MEPAPELGEILRIAKEANDNIQRAEASNARTLSELKRSNSDLEQKVISLEAALNDVYRKAGRAIASAKKLVLRSMANSLNCARLAFRTSQSLFAPAVAPTAGNCTESRAAGCAEFATSLIGPRGTGTDPFPASIASSGSGAVLRPIRHHSQSFPSFTGRRTSDWRPKFLSSNPA